MGFSGFSGMKQKASFLRLEWLAGVWRLLERREKQRSDLLKYMIDRLRAYFRNEIAHLPPMGLTFRRVIRNGGPIFLWWSVPAFLFVVLSSIFHENLPSQYFEAAISEGIGPHFWNVIGTMGLFLFGLLLLFPRSKILATGAHQALISTFVTGGLAWGLMFGGFASDLHRISTTIETWRVWVTSIGGLLLSLQVVFLNLALWYLGNLAKPSIGRNGFLHGVGQVGLPLRLFGLLLFSVIPMVLLIFGSNSVEACFE